MLVASSSRSFADLSSFVASFADLPSFADSFTVDAATGALAVFFASCAEVAFVDGAFAFAVPLATLFEDGVELAGVAATGFSAGEVAVPFEDGVELAGVATTGFGFNPQLGVVAALAVGFAAAVEEGEEEAETVS